jgi:hypothetical protein
VADQGGLATAADLEAAITGMLGLAVKGIKSADFQRYLGIDPDGLAEIAEATAQEEFDVLPGMPPGVSATGRLRGLSARQRKATKEALADTFVLALLAGVTLERARQERPA